MISLNLIKIVMTLMLSITIFSTTFELAWTYEVCPGSSQASGSVHRGFHEGGIHTPGSNVKIGDNTNIGEDKNLVSAIVVSPVKVEFSIGDSQSFTALAVYTDGSSEDITGVATWTPSINFQATEPGSFTVKAIYKGKTGSSSIKVKEPLIVSIAVNPATVNLEVGKSATFSAIATYENGDKKDITNKATWSPARTFQAVSPGEFKVTASLSGKEGRGNISVNRPVDPAYKEALSAVHACDFDRARNLSNQMITGPERSEVQGMLNSHESHEAITRGFFEEANGLYRSCKYDEAIAKLSQALTHTKCARFKTSLAEKVQKAKAGKTYEGTTNSLFNQANSLYKKGQYKSALASMEQARKHTKCGRHKQKINEAIARIKSKLDTQQKVASKDCSSLLHSKAYWDSVEQKYKCRCLDGYKMSKYACLRDYDSELAAIDCSATPNSEPYWNYSEYRASCRCRYDYTWDNRFNGCVSIAEREAQDDELFETMLDAGLEVLGKVTGKTRNPGYGNSPKNPTTKGGSSYYCSIIQAGAYGVRADQYYLLVYNTYNSSYGNVNVKNYMIAPRDKEKPLNLSRHPSLGKPEIIGTYSSYDRAMSEARNRCPNPASRNY